MGLRLSCCCKKLDNKYKPLSNKYKSCCIVGGVMAKSFWSLLSVDHFAFLYDEARVNEWRKWTQNFLELVDFSHKKY